MISTNETSLFVPLFIVCAVVSFFRAAWNADAV